MHISIAMVACTLLLACGEKKTESKAENQNSPPIHTAPKMETKEGPKPDINMPPKEDLVVSKDEQVAAKDLPSTAVEKATPTPHATPLAGTARIVVIIDHEALRSETRQLEKFGEKLAKDKKVEDAPTTDEEKAHFAALLAGSNAPLPGSWATLETVFVVGVASPSVTRRGKQVSEGFTGFAMYRPPQLEPVLAELSLSKEEITVDEYIKMVLAIYKESTNDQ